VQPGSFLNLMINSKHEASGRAVTNDEATAQAFTFLLAGYETTVTPLDEFVNEEAQQHNSLSHPSSLCCTRCSVYKLLLLGWKWANKRF
jgi:hypothetical protein